MKRQYGCPVYINFISPFSFGFDDSKLNFSRDFKSFKIYFVTLLNLSLPIYFGFSFIIFTM